MSLFGIIGFYILIVVEEVAFYSLSFISSLNTFQDDPEPFGTFILSASISELDTSKR